MSRNPSELARLEDEYNYYLKRAHNLSLGKSTREDALRECRKLEAQLGIAGKNYNGE